MDVHIVHEITEENHQDFLDKNFSVISFFSEDCMNCLMSHPILESLAEEFGENISFGKVDIEESKDVAEHHEVESVPTVMVYKSGELIERINNFDSEERLREIIDLILKD